MRPSLGHAHHFREVNKRLGAARLPGVLGPFDARVPVVAAQFPLVGADGQTAPRTDQHLAPLDATRELHPPASMGRPTHLTLALVFHHPLSSLRRGLNLARLRSTLAIAVNHALSLPNRGDAETNG